MFLGIVVALLLLGTACYVAWLVYESLGTGARMRRLEKEAMRRARREDREDRYRGARNPPVEPASKSPRAASDSSKPRRSSQGSTGRSPPDNQPLKFPE